MVLETEYEEADTLSYLLRYWRRCFKIVNKWSKCQK